MVIVGLTGGVGTGKSTVTDFFKDLGAYVIDWDELARKVMCTHSKVWELVVEHFGTSILNDDLTVNRHKLADLVFSDKQKLAKLNQIVHPRVFQEDERITNEIRNRDPDAFIIKDIPLLFEMTRPISLDKIIVVSASEQTQLRRLQERGMSRKDAKNRIRSQLPLGKKIKTADFVINNDGLLEQTKRQVGAIYSLLRQRESR